MQNRNRFEQQQQQQQVSCLKNLCRERINSSLLVDNQSLLTKKCVHFNLPISSGSAQEKTKVINFLTFGLTQDLHGRELDAYKWLDEDDDFKN